MCRRSINSVERLLLCFGKEVKSFGLSSRCRSRRREEFRGLSGEGIEGWLGVVGD